MADINSHKELMIHLREVSFQATSELLLDTAAPFYEQVSNDVIRLNDLIDNLETNQRGIKHKFMSMMFEQGRDVNLDEAIRLGNTLSCCLRCCVPHKYALCRGLSCVCCIYGTYAVDVSNVGERVIRVHAADEVCINVGKYNGLRLHIDSHGEGRVIKATYRTLSKMERDVLADELEALLSQCEH